MSTVFYEPCNNFNKWTKVETDGTVTVSSGTFVLSGQVVPLATTLGIQTTLKAATFSNGFVVYYQVKPEGGINLASLFSLQPTNSINDSSAWNLVQTGSNRDQMRPIFANTAGGGFTATTFGNDTIPNGSWTDIKMEYVASDGQIEFSYRPTPGGVNGEFDPDGGAWTTPAGSRYSIGSNILGNDVFIAISMIDIGNGTQISYDEIYVTTDGVIAPLGGGNGSSEDLLVLFEDY